MKMTCVQNVLKMSKANEVSEMEEGEIVDDLDDLSDISSEEEFLLRQRLEVLESYNNVLERKKAKRSFMGPGTKPKRDVLCDLSEVSAAELEDPQSHITYKQIKVQRHVKPHNKQKRRKNVEQYIDENNVRRKKDNQKRKTTRSKKRMGVTKAVSESSDESEDEYRNKRKKLANAVIVPRGKGDKSSLSARLHKMIHGSDAHINSIDTEHKDKDIIITNSQHIVIEEVLSPISSANAGDSTVSVDVPDGVLKDKNKTICELIELSTDDDVKIMSDIECQEKAKEEDMIKHDNDTKEYDVHIEKDSDEDLELLRQHALESKPSKPKAPEPEYKAETEQKLLSEDEDSDTAELRLICLKSALLKKAIEMKQKQKLQKKLSQSSNLEDDLFNDQDLFPNKIDSANNTDIESVDMDMGSDIEEKNKEINGENTKLNNADTVRLQDGDSNADFNNCTMNNFNIVSKDDELDDDEDLLRAKLLTSLSKNITNLGSPEVSNEINEIKKVDNATPQTVKLPETKKFIIKLDESDSEGEHEATKNLTKMHMKLSDQIDFQQKLDLFLKSTRKEVEKTKLPDVLQKPSLPKRPDKFIAKAVNHLPKSVQIEYKNLVRRMAELEKMKQTRQDTINFLKQPTKDISKTRNVTIDTRAAINCNIEDQIAKSRKTIAEESVKMLKLKEEATKLIQKHKIAAAELRNITTAINLNKRQQRAVQNSLSKIRLQHQSLLKSSTNSLHSKINGHIPHLSNLRNNALANKLQKEKNPKDEYRNPQVQKALKVSVVNDFVDEATVNCSKLSIQVDVANNKKIVKIPKVTDAVVDAIVEVTPNIVNEREQTIEEHQSRLCGNNNEPSIPEVEEDGKHNVETELVAVYDHGNKRYYISAEDYKSPLDSLGINTWQADPNAILCPFEVGGECKDPDCKYLHTPTLNQ